MEFKKGDRVKIVGNISSTARQFHGQMATIITVYLDHCELDIEFHQNQRKNHCGGIWFTDLKKLDLKDYCDIVNKAIKEANK